jgi:hypothetical protein
MTGRIWARVSGRRFSVRPGDWGHGYRGFGILVSSRCTETHVASYSVTRRLEDGSIDILKVERLSGTFRSEAAAKKAALSAAKWQIDSIGARN